jgi:hypothetical protein
MVAPLVGVLGETAPAMSAVMGASALIGVLVMLVGTPLFRRGGVARLDRASLRSAGSDDQPS